MGEKRGQISHKRTSAVSPVSFPLKEAGSKIERKKLLDLDLTFEETQQ